MNDFQTMIDYYPFLVEYCIEFKRFSRRYLAELKGRYTVEPSSARSAVVAEGYKLYHNQLDDKIYCIKENQSIDERMAEIPRFVLKPACAEQQAKKVA